MSRVTPVCLCLLAAAFAAVAPACDPAGLADPGAVAPRTSPPYDPTPTDLAAAPAECVCPDGEAPVCGEDGGTYPGACEAGCAGVDVAHEGACEEGPTACEGDADCEGWQFCDTGVSCGGPGECVVRPDLCTKLWQPVCGCDGETYGSECQAHIHGVSVAAAGACPSCVCPLIYQPVCGVDGVSYGNSCAAGCADVEVDHDGECGPDPGPQRQLR